MLVLLVVSLPQVKLGPDASYMLPISCSGTSVMQDAARTPSIPNLKRKIAVAAASDRSSAERRCEHPQASAGLPYQSVETICRMKSGSMMMTCCALG